MAVAQQRIQIDKGATGFRQARRAMVGEAVGRWELQPSEASAEVYRFDPDWERRVLTTPGVAEGIEYANKIIEDWKRSL
jgi:hypothetical protein